MASKSTAKRKYSPKPPVELDLKPIMNLMVVLIPMLLYSAQFIKFASINVTKASGGAPAPSSDVEKEPKPPLKLKVKITDEGFVIEGAMVLDEGTMIATPGDGGQSVELYTIDLDESKAEKQLELLRAEYKERKKPIPENVLEATKKVYSYNFLELNSKIGLIKKAVRNGDRQALANGEIEEGESQFDKAEQITIASQGDRPYELLVKVMDTVRCKMLTEEETKARKEKIALKKEKEGKSKIRNKNRFGCILNLDALDDKDANTYYYDVILDAKLLD